MTSVKININREDNYDFLRAISCIEVVMLHIASVYIKYDFREIVSDIDYKWAAFYRVMTNLAVPSFVMLSGAFLIKDGNENFKTFYKKMLYRILIPTFVFSVVFVIIHYCEIILAPLFGIDGLPVEKTDLRLPIVNWLKGVPHATMWFMYMIIGLYIVTPILVMIKKSINEKWYLWLGVGLFIYSVIINYTCELIWIAWFMQWIGYFVLGNVIHDCVNKFYDKNKSKKLPYVLLSISFLINFLYWFIFTYNTNDVVIPSSFSVPVIIGTILQFVAFAMLGDKITIGKNIKLISKYSFKIYMLHPIILEVAMQVLGRIIKWFPIAILIPIYSLGVTALCCIIAFGIECVKNKNCLGGKYK